MTTKKTEYVEIWENHVSQITRLGWNLPEKADRQELMKIKERLNEIIAKASEQVKEPLVEIEA